MIVTAFVSIITYFLSLLVAVFPESTGLPSELTAATNYLGGYLNLLDPIVPIDTLGTTLGILVLIELAIFGFKTAKWIISHLPMVGGRG